MNLTTVCVDFNVHGAWDVELPYKGEPVTCKTLDEATRVAYQWAADRRPCELIVRDAYHRVLRRELVNGEHAAPPRASA
ncbi:MAG: hypothetical protein ACTHMY_09730 [Solirubrobacteraceae bacterium]